MELLAGLVGVVVGAVLSGITTGWFDWRRSQDAAKSERRRLLVRYVGHLQIVVGFMTQWPEEIPPSPLERARAATFERSPRIRSRDWLNTQQRLREIFGETLYEPLHRMMLAYAELEFVELAPAVRVAVEDATAYVERLGHDRSAAALGDWTVIRRRLLQAIAETGDAPALAAPRPSTGISVA
jgi:hypothetical protein